MFIDKVQIQVKAGDGGDGAVSFHREKNMPNGGPDGGDGGRGGHVIFVARSGLSTLQAFQKKRKFQAEKGESGGNRKKYGRDGADLRIEVPVGTLITEAENQRILADLVEEGQEVIAARGGRGGKGNVHFANSVRQAPHFARIGMPGEEVNVIVELKLIADVGLIGFPNAGKSTLLSAISEARPKIGDYPFTTLEPQLGVVTIGESRFIVADIPGLIEGAHTGAGLGLDFLRHIERTRLLLHVLDLSSETGRDPLLDFEQLNRELACYDEKLAHRPQMVVLNKTDLSEPAETERVLLALKERDLLVFPICAVTGEGIPALMEATAALLPELPPVYLTEPGTEHVLYRFEEEKLFEIQHEGNIFRVTGTWIENLVRSTNFDKPESFSYFQRLIRRKGVIDALEKAGIREGDSVIMKDFEFEYYP